MWEILGKKRGDPEKEKLFGGTGFPPGNEETGGERERRKPN